jgi:cytochrome P450
LFGEQLTFLCSPEGLKFFYTAKEDVVSARHAYRFTVPVFGPNVVYDVDPEVLVEQKKFLKDGFTTERFRAYADMILAETEKYFEEEWGASGERDLFESFNTVTIFTSTLCLQGKEVRERFHKGFSQLYLDLDAALDPLGFFFPNAPLPAMLRRDGARKKLNDMFMEILKERKAKGDDAHVRESHFAESSCLFCHKNTKQFQISDY